MITVRWVRGDTRPTLRFTCLDEAGTAVVITGATPRLRIRRKGATAVLINRTGTVTNGPGGVWTWALAAADWNAGVIDAAGHYEGEAEITYADATIETAFDLVPILVREQVG